MMHENVQVENKGSYLLFRNKELFKICSTLKFHIQTKVEKKIEEFVFEEFRNFCHFYDLPVNLEFLLSIMFVLF
jgi:hypothetical protein